RQGGAFSEVALPESEPQLVFGAAASSDTSLWIVVRLNFQIYLFYHGIVSGAGDVAWTITPFQPRAYDFKSLAAYEDDVWAVGEYGRVYGWNGTEFVQAAITVTDFPVITPFYGAWTSHGELWTVGEGIALHRAKKAP